ncbi:MAG: leucine-rich repeat domain-containing protein [Bacteroidales bacterium]|nr:leucine-rich repeat domain-containing protein [Bacteroidales bacterium]
MRRFFKFFIVIVLFSIVNFELSVSFAQRDRVYKSLKEVRNPDSVYVLQLNYKRLKEIPPKVFAMHNLRKLDLGRNFIDSIPPEIGSLVHLEELDLRRNRIRVVPPEIGQLTRLRRINLSRNPILDLPDAMGNLVNLEELILWMTGIVAFPPTFVALNESLKLIDLRVCPLSYDDQQAIEELLPSPRKRWDYVCNCQ